jgi:Integrase core domain
MARRRGPPSQGWKTFLRNHAPDIAAVDLFVVPTIALSCYGLAIIHLERRRLVWTDVTANPTAEWIARQITEAFPLPWQNGHIERLIGSIRRECLAHVVVQDEAHLRRILRAYADYYNSARTHLALDKDVPLGRPAQALGKIVAISLLGGLHHQYVRIA